MEMDVAFASFLRLDLLVLAFELTLRSIFLTVNSLIRNEFELTSVTANFESECKLFEHNWK